MFNALVGINVNSGNMYVTVATIVGDVGNYVTVVLSWIRLCVTFWGYVSVALMDQCDSLITKLITVLLDWYSGDMY